MRGRHAAALIAAAAACSSRAAIRPAPQIDHGWVSIALYDWRAGILLTGDTFYPGRLYVRDTAAFAVSIARLAAFARSHPIRHILGAHIANTSTPYVDYPVGTVDQPQEHGLDARQLVRARLTRADDARAIHAHRSARFHNLALIA